MPVHREKTNSKKDLKEAVSSNILEKKSKGRSLKNYCHCLFRGKK